MRSRSVVALGATLLFIAACSSRQTPPFANSGRALTPNEAASFAAGSKPHAVDTRVEVPLEVMDDSIPSVHPDFEAPLESMTVINYYGWRKKRRGERMHEGVDFRAATGTPVYASAPGEIIHSGRGVKGYGRLVVVDHGLGWTTLYGHLSKLKVKVGQRVKEGELVGLAGRSGRAQGPHLHFEIRKGSDPLDPLLFVKGEWRKAWAGR